MFLQLLDLNLFPSPPTRLAVLNKGVPLGRMTLSRGHQWPSENTDMYIKIHNYSCEVTTTIILLLSVPTHEGLH